MNSHGYETDKVKRLSEHVGGLILIVVELAIFPVSFWKLCYVTNQYYQIGILLDLSKDELTRIIVYLVYMLAGVLLIWRGATKTRIQGRE